MEVVDKVLEVCLAADPKLSAGIGGDNMTCLIVLLNPTPTPSTKEGEGESEDRDQISVRKDVVFYLGAPPTI
jgi:hypothetical protein